ncbi:MAG: hypothetical protein ACP5TE_01810 [Verrucomicrobiia bacterium]|jgi:uncharacterized membrane protein
MQDFSRNSRQLYAVISLITTIFLLVGGQTVFKSYLVGKYYIVYWLFCLFFAVLSILLAILQLRSIGEQSRKEYKELVSKTIFDLNEIIVRRKKDKEDTKTSLLENDNK